MDNLILLSGGIDSATCVQWAVSNAQNVTAAFIDMGHPAAQVELGAAKAIARHYSVGLSVVRVSGFARIEPGYVFARNAFLMWTAAMIQRGSPGMITIGLHSGSRFADCTPEFMHTAQELLNHYGAGTVKFNAPFVSWHKAEIVDFARDSGVPLQLTYSCELGKRPPCGECPSCRDRKTLNVCP